MDPIDDSTWQYTQASHIAREYDDCYAGLALFDFDTRVLDRVLVEPGSLVDLGCGTGRHVVHLARRGFNVVGIDLSPFMLDEARDKLRRESLTAELVRTSITDLSQFPDRSFRYAICMFSTLGLIRGHDNRREFLMEVRRLLEPGGLLVVHVHNRLYRLWDREGACWLITSCLFSSRTGLEVGDMIGEYRGIPDMFLHLFSPGELKRLIREAGLELERMIPLNRARSGPLRRRFLLSMRANGLIAIARKA